MEEKLICGSGDDSTSSRLPLAFISALSGIRFPTVHPSIRRSAAPPWRRHTSTEPWRSVVNSEFSQRGADGKTTTHTLGTRQLFFS